MKPFKVRCVDSGDFGRAVKSKTLTIGKVYTVYKEDLSYYTLIDDLEEESYFYKNRFVVVNDIQKLKKLIKETKNEI